MAARALTAKEARRSLDRYEAKQAATSKIDPDVRKALEEADHTIVAETDEYFIYSDGSLTPGYFGVRYSLRASTLDGSRIHVAEASFSTNSAGEPIVNLGPSSMTFDRSCFARRPTSSAGWPTC